MSLSWAIHRLNGVSSPANAAYNADELRHQLTNSGAKFLFTVLPLLPVALEAAEKSGISKDKVFICEVPGDGEYPKEFKTLSQLLKQGETAPAIEPVKWSKGQGARQTAFLCYSSGTSGLPVCYISPLKESSSPAHFTVERSDDLSPQRDRQHRPNIRIR
jgi:acyl-CoA synthetase (AMP-forming)/AMP-acid ligase II